MFWQRHHEHDLFTWHSRLELFRDASVPVIIPSITLHPTQEVLFLQGAICNNRLTNQGILKFSRQSRISLVDLIDTLFRIEVDSA